MKKTDEQLISDYLEGDDKSLELLVNRYLSDAYNFAHKLVRDREVSQDITQESFVKVWKNIRKYRQGSNFKTWLFTIIRNTAIDWLRQKRDLTFSFFENKKGENIFVENLVDETPLADELLVQAQDAVLVEELLAELNPLYRDVLTLRYSSNFTFEEIGEFLKKPLHTVKSQHRRALATIRRLLQVEIS